MVQQRIDVGTTPGDGTGDTPKEVGDKVNNNFDELYADKALSHEEAELADDATHEFTTIPLEGNFNLFIVGGRQFLAASAALFYSLSGSNIELGKGGSVSVGTSSNPDVDGNLNLWINTTNDTLQVKNRIGSTVKVTAIRIGEIGEV